MTSTDALNLDPIWDRSNTYMALWDAVGNRPTPEQIAAASATAEDVRALIAEVERFGHELEEAKAELAMYHKGMYQLAYDPPSLTSPHVEIDGGIETDRAIHLQQTHQGVPVWICQCCEKVSVWLEKPQICTGCASEDMMGAALHDVGPFEDYDEIAQEFATKGAGQ